MPPGLCFRDKVDHVSSKRSLRHKKFCLEAYEMRGQNSLMEHLIKVYLEKDAEALKALGADPSASRAQFFLLYRAYGDFYTRYHWLKGELEAAPEEMAKYHMESRNELFHKFAADHNE